MIDYITEHIKRDGKNRNEPEVVKVKTLLNFVLIFPEIKRDFNF